MFEDLLNNLNELEDGIELSIPVETDEEGYFDRECPSEECQFQFKVFEDDWENLIGDEAVCPLCGNRAPSDHWWTQEQIEHAEGRAKDYVSGIIDDGLRKATKKFNRSQSDNQFLKMSMEYQGTRKDRAIIPIPSKDTFRLKIECGFCGTRYSVIGSAFFCPNCGKSSAINLFDDALDKVKTKIDSIDSIKNFFNEQDKVDEGEVLTRSLIETSLVDCVVAVQHFAEQMYNKLENVPEPSFNVFQRIDDSNELWKKAVGIGYDDWLTKEELEKLKILFQKRHLLAHCEGIVDEMYLEKTGDDTYEVGQRIVINKEDVYELIDIIEKLASAIKKVFK